MNCWHSDEQTWSGPLVPSVLFTQADPSLSVILPPAFWELVWAVGSGKEQEDRCKRVQTVTSVSTLIYIMCIQHYHGSCKRHSQPCQTGQHVAQVPGLKTACSLAIHMIKWCRYLPFLLVSRDGTQWHLIQISKNNTARLQYLAHLVANHLISIAEHMDGRWEDAPTNLARSIDEYEVYMCHHRLRPPSLWSRLSRYWWMFWRRSQSISSHHISWLFMMQETEIWASRHSRSTWTMLRGPFWWLFHYLRIYLTDQSLSLPHQAAYWNGHIDCGEPGVSSSQCTLYGCAGKLKWAWACSALNMQFRSFQLYCSPPIWITIHNGVHLILILAICMNLGLDSFVPTQGRIFSWFKEYAIFLDILTLTL